jgi:hypothetical protein
VFLVFLPQFVDTINHLLYKLNLGVSQSVLVGDVISVTSLAARFSTGSTGLKMKFLTTGLQFVNGVLGPSGKINVDGSSHTGTKIGGARVNVTILFIKAEVLARFLLDRFSDSLDTSAEPLEDSLDVTSHLHGDDTELILFIDPDKEGLGVIVVDTTALGPITFHTGNLEVAISGNKEEMIINELLADLLIHASQGVVGTGKISGKISKGLLHQSFNTDTLFLGDSGRESETINGATDANSARVNGNIAVNVSLDFGRIHV